MSLDPSIRARLDAVAALGLPPSEQLTPAEARQRLITLVEQLPPPANFGVKTQDISIPGESVIPARLYTPEEREDLPLVVYFHGGGWVTGTLASHDRFCRLLAHEAQTVVLSVAYRLAPEHPFPAAPEDCLAATDWAFANAALLACNPDRIYVAGDSAGGNLAAVVSLMSRD